MLTTTNYGLKKPELTDNVNIGDLNDNADKIDQQMKSNADAAAAASQSASNVQQSLSEHQADTMQYSIYKSGLDVNGIYAVVDHKRADGTLILHSVLSGGTSPQYTTRTETYYKSDGTTVDKTIIYTITYDANGMVSSEVRQ